MADCTHSLRYHRLHPEYVHGRIQKLGKAYLLRVLLVQVDVKDPQEVIKELTKVAIINDLTLMCAWS
jgi:DNA excision repair protein ERCC-1